MYLQYIFTTFKVDCIVLFGQARPHHAKAMVLASLLGIKVVVVEEGYFRPRFLSMELGGVNGFSSTLERYRRSSDWQDNRQQVPQVNAWAQSVCMGWYPHFAQRFRCFAARQACHHLWLTVLCGMGIDHRQGVCRNKLLCTANPPLELGRARGRCFTALPRLLGSRAQRRDHLHGGAASHSSPARCFACAGAVASAETWLLATQFA